MELADCFDAVVAVEVVATGTARADAGGEAV